jgi:hypothetical protein
MKKRGLIMSAGAGTAHNKAAEALEKSFAARVGLLKSSIMMGFNTPTNFSWIYILDFTHRWCDLRQISSVGGIKPAMNPRLKLSPHIGGKALPPCPVNFPALAKIAANSNHKRMIIIALYRLAQSSLKVLQRTSFKTRGSGHG